MTGVSIGDPEHTTPSSVALSRYENIEGAHALL